MEYLMIYLKIAGMASMILVALLLFKREFDRK